MEITVADILLLTPIAICSAIFCVFLAIGVGYISFSKQVPKTIFWIAIITQAALSVGIFIMATLWYYSQITPEGMPKDFITGAAIAYTAGAFPGTTLGLIVIIFSIIRAQLKRIFKEHSDEELDNMIPSIRMQALIDRYYQDMKRAERQKAQEQAQLDSESVKPKRKSQPKKEDKDKQTDMEVTAAT